MNAEPGDLVECIDDKPSRKGLPVMVEKGKIYLVQGVTLTPTSKRPAYLLKDVYYPGTTQHWEQSQYRFRKVKPPSIPAKKLLAAPKSKELEKV